MERQAPAARVSVRLALATDALEEGGGIFVAEMKEPVKIVDLARDLIRAAGLEPEQDIKILFTGLRPGRLNCRNAR
jgi:FlaA1/EpsC-like NDP-sugar epimerase